MRVFIHDSFPMTLGHFKQISVMSFEIHCMNTQSLFNGVTMGWLLRPMTGPHWWQGARDSSRVLSD